MPGRAEGGVGVSGGLVMVYPLVLTAASLTNTLFSQVTGSSPLGTEANAVDAVGYSFRLTDPTPLHTYLMDVRPSMPIFQTHHHDNTLRDELVRVRAFLDRMRMDDSQEGMDEAQVEFWRKQVLGIG